MPQIAVVNESTVITDAAVQAYLPAFDQQWNRDLRPVWGIDAATFIFVPQNQALPSGTWWLVFLDDSDQADALGYDDLTDEGLPISKVFVKTIQAHNASVSVGATHEICGMAVDPWLNRVYQDAAGVFWAGEVCAPVADDQYGYLIDGIRVTDFVTPNWFAPNARGSIDLTGHAGNAFEVLSGGYAQKFTPGLGWQQVTGGEAKITWWAHAPQGSRRERRTRQLTKQFFVTHVVGSEELPNVAIITLPEYPYSESVSDMTQLMNYMSGEFIPRPDTLTTDINPDHYRTLLADIVTDAQQREDFPPTPQTLLPYVDSIISNCPLPTMHYPISGETLLHMITAAGSSAALLASFNPIGAATAIPLYFLIIGGRRIVLGASDGIAIALRQGLSTILLKWMGVPKPKSQKKSGRARRAT